MSCPFAQDAAAYVLGALSPAERLEFERHLGGCDDCTRAIRELAGIPGLLGRVEPSVLEHPPADGPVPDTLLPALSRRGARRPTSADPRRRGGGRCRGGGAGVRWLVSQVGGGDGSSTPDAPGPSTEPAAVVAEAMEPVGDVPVRASLSLERSPGAPDSDSRAPTTRTSVEYDLPPAVDYTLCVRTWDGRTEKVGSWRSVGGRRCRSRPRPPRAVTRSRR